MAHVETLGRGRPAAWTQAHHASWTQPLAVGYLRKRRVKAVDVVGGRAGVTAQQLPTIFTHSAELHVIVLFLTDLLFLPLFTLGLPLDPLFFLRKANIPFGYTERKGLILPTIHLFFGGIKFSLFNVTPLLLVRLVCSFSNMNVSESPLLSCWTWI